MHISILTRLTFRPVEYRVFAMCIIQWMPSPPLPRCHRDQRTAFCLQRRHVAAAATMHMINARPGSVTLRIYRVKSCRNNYLYFNSNVSFLFLHGQHCCCQRRRRRHPPTTSTMHWRTLHQAQAPPGRPGWGSLPVKFHPPSFFGRPSWPRVVSFAFRWFCCLTMKQRSFAELRPVSDDETQWPRYG